MTKVAVIGAGVIGLSTATTIQNVLPNAEFTIFAEKFSPDTTSNVAAGIFRPSVPQDFAPSDAVLHRWLMDSSDHWFSLAYSRDSQASGVYQMPLHQLANKPIHGGYLAQATMGFRALSADELRLYSGYTHGSTCTTVVMETDRYMPYLLSGLQRKGEVSVEHSTVKSLEEVAADFDLVVNCSGWGARKLCNDQQMTPIRGQLLRVQAPWVQFAAIDLDDYKTYVIPNTGYVVLGGTRQLGDDSCTVRSSDSENIWSGALRMIPALAGARVISEAVGLRPHRRGGVRLEVEQMAGKPVVHNYGHSGHGVSFSWGTAVHAAQLAKQAMSDRLSKL